MHIPTQVSLLSCTASDVFGSQFPLRYRSEALQKYIIKGCLSYLSVNRSPISFSGFVYSRDSICRSLLLQRETGEQHTCETYENVVDRMILNGHIRRVRHIHRPLSKSGDANFRLHVGPFHIRRRIPENEAKLIAAMTPQAIPKVVREAKGSWVGS